MNWRELGAVILIIVIFYATVALAATAYEHYRNPESSETVSGGSITIKGARLPVQETINNEQLNTVKEIAQ